MTSLNNRANAQTSSTSIKQTIMIVDDHPLVCKGLEELIKSTLDLAVFGVAGNATQVMCMLQQGQPDLLLLDLSLPETSGLDLLKDLHSFFPELRVLVLSMHDENIYTERVLRAGARGYIMKQEPGEKVIDAIRCVLAGNLYASPSLLAQLLKKLAANGDFKTGAPTPEILTDRELQIYSLIGEAFTSKEIAEKLHLSPKTIQTHRENIKTKLGLESSIELTRSAILWIKARQ